MRPWAGAVGAYVSGMGAWGVCWHIGAGRDGGQPPLGEGGREEESRPGAGERKPKDTACVRQTLASLLGSGVRHAGQERQGRILWMTDYPAGQETAQGRTLRVVLLCSSLIFFLNLRRMTGFRSIS